jgi:hypothetical protein
MIFKKYLSINLLPELKRTEKSIILLLFTFWFVLIIMRLHTIIAVEESFMFNFSILWNRRCQNGKYYLIIQLIVYFENLSQTFAFFG